MKPILLLAMLPMLLAACSPYEYFTLSSPDLQKNQRNEFIAENDTVRVTYNFGGYGCPVRISLYNKTDKPLLINWKRSAIVLNDSATSLYNPDYQLHASEQSIQMDEFIHKTSSGTLNGVLKGTDDVSLIPPKAAIAKTITALPIKAANAWLFEKTKKEHLQLSSELQIPYKKIEFDTNRTPVSIRTFLTFSLNDKEFNTENRFFVKEIWQTSTDPVVFSDGSGDKFYVKE